MNDAHAEAPQYGSQRIDADRGGRWMSSLELPIIPAVDAGAAAGVPTDATGAHEGTNLVAGWVLLLPVDDRPLVGPDPTGGLLLRDPEVEPAFLRGSPSETGAVG